MAPSEMVQASEVQIYERTLYKVLKILLMPYPGHPVTALYMLTGSACQRHVHVSTTALRLKFTHRYITIPDPLHASQLQQTQTPERRPAQHGVLDSRLVRPLRDLCNCSEALLGTISAVPKPYQGLLLLNSWPMMLMQPGIDRQYA